MKKHRSLNQRKSGDSMDYTDRLRGLREDRDLSQKTIAALLHVGQKTYSDYEIKKIRIPLESIILLARFYNVDLNYICGVSGHKHPFPNE